MIRLTIWLGPIVGWWSWLIAVWWRRQSTMCCKRDGEWQLGNVSSPGRESCCNRHVSASSQCREPSCENFLSRNHRCMAIQFFNLEGIVFWHLNQAALCRPCSPPEPVPILRVSASDGVLHSSSPAMQHTAAMCLPIMAIFLERPAALRVLQIQGWEYSASLEGRQGLRSTSHF